MDKEMNFDERWKEVNAYFRSRENIEICKPFMIECQRLAKVAMQHQDQCGSIFDQLNSKTVREEYSAGGKALHRGYYCPSPVFDIVTGKSNRGKLLKRLTSRSRPSFKYCFDKDDRMIIVSNQSDGKEIVLRDGNVETGIGFSERHGISTLAECTYDGSRILSYIYCSYNRHESLANNYRREDYEYSEEGIKSLESFDFFRFRGSQMLRHKKYIFQHDEEGFLSSYTVVEYEKGSVKEDFFWKDHVFDVCLKRKV